MEQILKWDLWLFHLINKTGSNSFFDALMPHLRNALLWYPLYLFMILFAVFNYKKNGWWWTLFAAITIIVTNYISSDIVKGNIMRLRPCNDPALADWVNVIVGYRPKNSSFTSSHAANHFAMAMYFFMTLKQNFGKWIPGLFFIWAAFICYAQIYVGVHYPLDILGGAIIGIVIGYLCAKAFNKYFSLL